MKNIEDRLHAQEKQNVLTRMFKHIRGMIRYMFEPQEVEIFFDGEGKNISYTYTRVSEKQVA